MQNKHTFHVTGMHCKACTVLTESVLRELPEVKAVHSSLRDNSISLSANFGSDSLQDIAAKLTKILEPHGYSVSTEVVRPNKKLSDFNIAIPVALGFAILFVILQKLGIVNLITAKEMTYGTAALIGVIASLSSCMAVVGGLVLSMSATFAKEGKRLKPQLLFHIGRLVSFFVFGGVIGILGKAFTLNSTASFILSFLIGIVMLIMGINLLDVFPWAKRLTPSLPKFFGEKGLSLSRLNNTVTPALVGLITFFLPCGFTQSMQLSALSAGGFMQGALTMFIFALGTLPVLALVSFSSFSIKSSNKSGIFFRSAGLIIIMFAIFNIINSLVAIGAISPVFNF